MSTVVGITDRAGFDQRVDNIVVVDPARTTLQWVPRDLWCPRLRNRVNAAFGRGGHAALTAALGEHGIYVEHSLLVSRTATERALEHASVLVPIPAVMTFRYPLSPTEPIENGAKDIAFRPPAEILRGERIHQWIGARTGGDLHRLERQKIFVRRLLDQRFDFAQVLDNPSLVRLSSPDALREIAAVDLRWQFTTFGPTTPAVIDGMDVLVSLAGHEPALAEDTHA